MDQGGAIFDLRPYVAKLHWPVGIGTPHVQDASYPFLMQEKYRAGYFTHYAGEGTIRSAKICHNGEEVDLCLCRTKAHFSQEGSSRILTLAELREAEVDMFCTVLIGSAVVKTVAGQLVTPRGYRNV